MALKTLSKKKRSRFKFFDEECLDLPIEKSLKIERLLKLKPKHFQGTWV
jgi:hypothetical protein